MLAVDLPETSKETGIVSFAHVARKDSISEASVSHGMSQFERAMKARTHVGATWNGTVDVMNMPAWQSGIVQRLSRLAQLPANWDGYGSPPINVNVRSIAASIILAFPSLDNIRGRVSPNPGGGIQIELARGEDVLELHIQPNTQVEYLLIRNNEEKEGEFDPASVKDRIRLMSEFLN